MERERERELESERKSEPPSTPVLAMPQSIPDVAVDLFLFLLKLLELDIIFLHLNSPV